MIRLAPFNHETLLAATSSAGSAAKNKLLDLDRHATIIKTMNTAQRRTSKLTMVAAEALGKLAEDRAFLDDLFEKLFHVAQICISRWYWPNGREPQPDAIAAEAIEGIWHGERSWNPEVRTLYHECCRVISSLVWEELRKTKRFVSLSEGHEGQNEEPDGSILSQHDPLAELEYWNEAKQLQSPSSALASTGLCALQDWGDLPIRNVDIVLKLSHLRELLPVDRTPQNEILRKVVDEIAFSYPEREPPKAGNRQQ